MWIIIDSTFKEEVLVTEYEIKSQIDEEFLNN